MEAGLALAEMIAGMSKPCVSLVLGGGHSIGITLAVSARHSYISPTACMTIHPIRMNGLVIGAPQTFEFFNKMQQRIISFVCAHAKIGEEHYRRLMMQTDEIANDCGTVLVGAEAVKLGIIDEIGTLQTALHKGIQPGRAACSAGLFDIIHCIFRPVWYNTYRGENDASGQKKQSQTEEKAARRGGRRDIYRGRSILWRVRIRTDGHRAARRARRGMCCLGCWDCSPILRRLCWRCSAC